LVFQAAKDYIIMEVLENYNDRKTYSPIHNSMNPKNVTEIKKFENRLLFSFWGKFFVDVDCGIFGMDLETVG
jgi:hypothetical protein